MMPIGAKMYEEAAKAEKPAEDGGEDKKDGGEPVEGEVIDEKDK